MPGLSFVPGELAGGVKIDNALQDGHYFRGQLSRFAIEEIGERVNGLKVIPLPTIN